MPLIKRSTPEEKEAQAREKRLKQRQQAIEKLRSDFFASPAGQARLAFERGDAVLQYSLDVHQTQAIVVPMIGAYGTAKATTDPTAILNSVCNEGVGTRQRLVRVLELGSESRDRFMASGQQAAVKGTIIGYYLFGRSETKKKETGDPWDAELIPVGNNG